MTTEFTALVEEQAYPEAYRALRDAAYEVVDYAGLRRLARAHKRLRHEAEAPRDWQRVRVGLMGNATTTFIAAVLPALLDAQGVVTELYEAPFDAVAAEVLRADSPLVDFHPDVIVVVDSPLAICDWPEDTVDQRAAQVWAEARARDRIGLLETASDRCGAEIVADNLHLLPTRPHGSYGRRLPGDPNNLIRHINRLIDTRASGGIHVHDVETLAAIHGLSEWVDMRYWYHAKQPVSFVCLPAYTRSLAAVTGALRGPQVKCIVLDLDNTMWGGVVGDDGVCGIKLGPGDPEGEAFLAFQQYLARLKARGIVLAVCSKNDIANAREPFEKLEGLPLGLDDFAMFVANWEPKPANLLRIAEELNLGVDALAFVDDNPAERAHVRATLPAARVVELPADPAEYASVLDASGWFETIGVSSEDLARTSQYRANTERAALKAGIDDYDAYLRSLDQVARIRPFQPEDLDRITQLINKTNQFNLTTRRVQRSEVADLAERDDHLTATVRLSDRFGDNGIISVLYGRFADDTLIIDQWLMSCRVFSRGVEHLLMNTIVEQAGAAGARCLEGEYRPTKKNHLVADLYPRLGFEPVEGSEGDVTQRFRLLLASYEPFPVRIEQRGDDGA